MIQETGRSLLCGWLLYRSSTNWLFIERILLQSYSEADSYFLFNLMSAGNSVSYCPNSNLLRKQAHSHTHTLHHFTRHQTLTKSLFSAACWHSNSRLTKSHAGRILITASQSQSCMGERYLHMRGEEARPTHIAFIHFQHSEMCISMHGWVYVTKRNRQFIEVFLFVVWPLTCYTREPVQIFPVVRTRLLNLFW